MGNTESIINHVRTICRNRTGLTQQDLADAVGVTRQTIVAVEKGSYNPSVGLVLRLAKVLDTPVEDLFELQES